jgi:hypothetical protein
MKFSASDGWVGRSGWLLGALALGGCLPWAATSMPAPADEVGSIVLTLTEAPGDVRCLRVSLDDGATRRLFPATPGESAMLTLDAVPAGPVRISEDALPVTCAAAAPDTAATWISERTVAATVVPGESTTVAIVLRPTGAVRVTNDFDGGALTISPGTGDLGTAGIGTVSPPVTFTVRNAGTRATATLRAALMGSGAPEMTIASNSCGTLTPGATCTITVTMRPTTPGAKTATLTVSGSPGGTATAVLVGTALNPPTLSITPSELDFGSVAAPAMSVPGTFFVTNTGQSEARGLVSTLIAISTGGVVFRFVTDSCVGTTLAPGATCTVVLRGVPGGGNAAARPIRTATLTVTAAGGVTAQALLRMSVF